MNPSHYPFIFILLLIGLQSTAGQENREIYAIVGRNVSLPCNTLREDVAWTLNGKNILKDDKRITTTSATELKTNELHIDDGTGDDSTAKTRILIHTLNLLNVQLKDAGNYTCHFRNADKSSNTTSYYIQPVIPPKIVSHNAPTIKTKIFAKNIELYCVIQAYPLDYFKTSMHWKKEEVDITFDKDKDFSDLDKINAIIENRTKIVEMNATHANVTLKINEINKKDNGTYSCTVLSSLLHYEGDDNDLNSRDEDDIKIVKQSTVILVLDIPYVSIDYVQTVGESKIFMNWTLNDGNDPVKLYYIQFMENGTTSFNYYYDRVSGNQTSHVFDKFKPQTSYKFKLAAQNGQGMGTWYEHAAWVKTLEKDPDFVPQVAVKGNTHSTITIGWTPPPPHLLEYIQFYELIVSHADNQSIKETVTYQQNSRNLPYMFDNLRTATEYNFKVRACSELTRKCGNWSEMVSGMTMDGTSSEPLNLLINCSYFNISRRNQVSLTWEPPTNKNGKLMSYHVVLDGSATFRSEYGTMKNETWGPKVKSVNESLHRAMYDGVPPNTNYTVSVSGITRAKRPGEVATATCRMPPTVPDTIGRFMWGKVKTETGNWVFKLFLPRISERNGPICCYRIYLVRIASNLNGQQMPLPEDLEVMTYHEVHSANNTRGGAYLAEVLPSDDFHSKIFLGDGRNIKSTNASERSHAYTGSCKVCTQRVLRRAKKVIVTTTTTAATPLDGGTTAVDDFVEDDEVAELVTAKSRRRKRRRRRQHDEDLSTTNEEAESTITLPPITIHSTSFDIYDGHLDMASNYTGFVEVIVNNNGEPGSIVLSSFSEYFQTITPAAEADSADNQNSWFVHLSILFSLLLLAFLAMACCFIFDKRRFSNILSGRSDHHQHRHLIGTVSSKPPDMAPILKHELPQAYVDRHKDSDYGFQHEFEMLPDRFNDRTTKNSDAKENVYKNRYPDIKAYDQTRVKLSTINSTIGSDYINANFVIGYKERKKFICAQGPMDSTVTDFWRMIWEQHLEIIVMLTNLEEYNKSKCAKYWPEKIAEGTAFGDITVTFQKESRLSDYLVRDLKVTKRTLNGEETEETRTITQYHYLVWKDFMAPEHPQGIIKFIKQINSVYSLQRGPILVHCSAGVGRTGTLVALDSMIQQLNEEGTVSIFNTICDMRHQRNYLVQSLKQYIFLYRALTEIAQFGDTELPYKGLNGAIETLKQRLSDSKEQCKLELEYERIKSIQEETKKTCAVGSGEENQAKNRSNLVIPFDRNRVILSPVPGREHSTYINASFIEGYDNAESFIIAQDTLEHTITDFWRMISEQGINTVVMLSEIGEGPQRCPRYWADDEIQYEHILVKYIQSESCPYYTRREFTVTNCKSNNDTLQVTQFQYHGWPTVEGEVPEVTRGMIEIVNQAQNHHANSFNEQYSTIGPILVHCNLGTDRSSIFVIMCSLVQQLKLEKKVDICTTVRKLRSQRNMMIDTYAQYEFLHRAIVNYADLHKTSLDSLNNDC